jgi:hypothetical protein
MHQPCSYLPLYFFDKYPTVPFIFFGIASYIPFRAKKYQQRLFSGWLAGISSVSKYYTFVPEITQGKTI